jgi:simple sugar transport system ATP-binding protein
MKKMHREAEKVLDDIGLKSLSDPTLPVENLSGGEQQSVKIGRALYFDADLLVLDEPLRALSVKEGEKVLRTLKRTKEQGVSMIYITHNIFHAYEVADRFQLIDNGHNAGEFEKDELDGPQQLVESLKYVAGGGDLEDADEPGPVEEETDVADSAS